MYDYAKLFRNDTLSLYVCMCVCVCVWGGGGGVGGGNWRNGKVQQGNYVSGGRPHSKQRHVMWEHSGAFRAQ